MDSLRPRTMGSLLLADAEPAGRASVQAALTGAGWEVLVAATGERAKEIIEARSLDLVLVDLRLPDQHGVTWIEQVRLVRPGLPVVAMAAQASIDLAVEAMRAGAVDFLARPLDPAVLLRRISAWTGLGPAGENRVTRLGDCVSRVPAVQAVLTEAGRLAMSDWPVVICGAPGCGRKHLAAAMHRASGHGGALQTLDATLLSAEQVRTRLGQCIEASGPTGAVLVADIQARPTEQDALARLLRASSGLPRMYLTLSDTPQKLLAAGTLTRSLAQCLTSAVLSLPPLAARQADIALLASDLIGTLVPGVPPALGAGAMRALEQYDWPGNVRQLRMVLERAARLAGAGPIEVRHLPILQAVHRNPVPSSWTAPEPIHLQEIVDGIERELIESALLQTGSNQAKAAVLLGVPRTTLRDKLEKHGFTGRNLSAADAI
jgi:DNA-binding NtrC family response regulator